MCSFILVGHLGSCSQGQFVSSRNHLQVSDMITMWWVNPAIELKAVIIPGVKKTLKSR